MRSHAVLGALAGLLVFAAFACTTTSDPLPMGGGKPYVPEGGTVLADGAVVGPDGAVIPDPDAAATANGVTVTTEKVDVGGNSREYVLAFPNHYDAAKKYPLVLVFHGDGGDGPGMRGYHKLDDETGEDAIVVYPSGNWNTWDLTTPFDQNEDQQYVEAIIGALKGKYAIDRVFGVGYSSGGFLINMLACRRPGIFKAIVSHAGGAPFSTDPNGLPKDGAGYFLCPNSPKVAALIMHGDADNGVDPGSGDYDAQFWAHYNGCNPDTNARVDTAPAPCKAHASCSAATPVLFCLIPGLGHWPWDQSIPLEWAWLKTR